MVFGKVFEKFAQRHPTAVMVQALLGRTFSAEAVDQLFHQHSEWQYEKELLFSSAVDLLALVVCGEHPSVRKAYEAMREELPVSLTAVYAKLNGVEPRVSEALVDYSATALSQLIKKLGAQSAPWLPGHRIKILDGNHIAATERRLAVLRECAAGPLPGLSLVVLEPETGLVTQMVACEDGHAQERSLLSSIIARVEPHDVFIADRNFCTLGLLSALHERNAFFVIRQHAQMPVESTGTHREAGRVATGTLSEESISIHFNGKEVGARRIVLQLEEATRDGDTELAILTNLPADVASAEVIAELYAHRWTIESLFGRIERNLKSELKSLGDPRAALFVFALSLTISNIFAVVQAALRAAQQATNDENLMNMPLSEYALVEEARVIRGGMMTALDEEDWEPVLRLSTAEFAAFLLRVATNAPWKNYRKAVRGPKTVRKRTKFVGTPHVSTAKLLGRA